MIGVEVPVGIHTRISGIDLVRDSKTGEFPVLEDNARHAALNKVRKKPA